MTTTNETERTEHIGLTRLAISGLLAAVVAGVVNVLVRVLATTLFDVPDGYQVLGLGPVVTTTLVGVIVATAVYGIVARVSKRPNRTFLSVAVVVLLLSFGPLIAPPAFLADAPPSVIGTLAAMHVTTAVIVVGLLVRASTREVGSR